DDPWLSRSYLRDHSTAGYFRDAARDAQDNDIQQAYATYVAQLGSGLKIDAGKFVNHCSYEVIEGYDGWNDNASHSFLFGYAIPFTHTGARASYAFSKRVTAMLMVVNGWDVAEDNNRSKSVGGQLLLTPVVPLTVTLNGMFGPERANDESDARALFDGTAVWKVTEHVTLGANGDWGRERGAVVAGQ